MTRPRLPINPVDASTFRRGGGRGEPAPPQVPPERELDEPLLLDSREVALLLRVSRSKAFHMISTGVIPVIHIGRCARVPRAALERWISDQTMEPRSQTRPGVGNMLAGQYGSAHT
jgi:excisionase family DNA binding protein